MRLQEVLSDWGCPRVKVGMLGNFEVDDGIIDTRAQHPACPPPPQVVVQFLVQ